MITKNELVKYEGVRVSGITNMFNIPLVSQLTGLSKEQIIDIMNNYSEYMEKFNIKPKEER
jgi:hypothetical protein